MPGVGWAAGITLIKELSMEFMELVSGFAQNLAVALMPVLVGYVVFWVKAQLDVKKAELQNQYPVRYPHTRGGEP